MILPSPDATTVWNHFELRWVDGYGAVSDVPGSLALVIEAVSDLPSSLDRITLAVRRAHTAEGALSIGILRLDVTVSSGPRVLRFLHAVVFPPGYRPDDAAWQAIVTRRYGDSAELRIRDLYEELAVTAKELGRERLAPLDVSYDDVVGVLGVPGASIDQSDDETPDEEVRPDPVVTTGTTVRPSHPVPDVLPGGTLRVSTRLRHDSSPRDASPARLGSGRLWTVAVAAAIAVALAVFSVWRHSAPPDRALQDELHSALVARDEAITKLAAATAGSKLVESRLQLAEQAVQKAQDAARQAEEATGRCQSSANVELTRKLDDEAQKTMRATGERDAARKERDEARHDSEQLRDQMTTLSDEVAKLRTTVVSVTKERDATAHTTSDLNAEIRRRTQLQTELCAALWAAKIYHQACKRP